MGQRIGKMLFLLFSTGMAAGILAAFFLRGYLLDEFDVMQKGLLNSLDAGLYSRASLFMFLFWQRLKQAVFLLFLLMTAMGLPFLYFLAGFAGAAGGCFLFVSCCQYGVSGTVVFAAGFFPQILCYLPLIFLFVRQGLGWKEEKRRRFAGRLGLFCLEVMLLFLGCFFEACFNPPLLRWILHFMV